MRASTIDGAACQWENSVSWGRRHKNRPRFFSDVSQATCPATLEMRVFEGTYNQKEEP